MHLLRKLLFVFGLAALMVAQPGYALGLGESELHSALNQPLKADIRLNNLGDLTSEEIIVRLASNADFERAGLERLEYYGQLEFELMLDHEDGPMVRVSTQEPVKEPYLNFLVEARWASGRLLREYTLLLDLPTYDDDRQAQPVQAASSRDQQTSPRPSAREPSRESRERREAPESGGTASGYDGDTYSVGGSDTLWEIALQVRPGRDLSVQQTMLAIQRKNPDAFINGNINLLREGQVLRLPNRDEIRNFNQQNAVQEVAQHNREWSDRAMGAQLDAGQRSTGNRQGPSDVSGQVRLAAPSESEGDEAGQGGGDNAGSGEELEAELAVTQEELDKSRRENRELSSRVEELESQIETMESLIEASNEQMRALQAGAQERREAEESAEADEDEPRDEIAEREEADASQGESAEAAEDERADAQPSDAEETEATESAPAADEDRGRRVVRSIPQEKTLVDHLMDNILWIAGAALLILLGVYYAIRRRQQNDQEAAGPEEDFEPDFEEQGFAEEFDTTGEDVDLDAQGIDLADDTMEEEAPAWDEDVDDGVEAETGDVVGEADIYIAYGKLEQAEELLLKGLEQEPTSPAILSKLLEVYTENRDVEAFDRYYAVLLNTDDRAAIQRAGEMRDTIPGAGEFNIDALGAAPNAFDEEAGEEDFGALDASDSDDLDFKFDLDEAGSDEQTLSTDETDERESSSNELNLDEDFNFDLDDDLELDSEDETDAPVTTEGDLDSPDKRYDLSFDEAPEETGDEFTLDFDLEDDGEQVELGDSATAANEATDDEITPLTDMDDALTDEDDWNFDLDETPEADELKSLDESLADLDADLTDGDDTSGETVASSEPVSEPAPVEDDNSIDFDVGEDADDELTVHESGMDKDATSEDEQETEDDFADLDADLDEGLSEDWSDAQSDKEPELESAAESDTDLDLDDLQMSDMDLSSLDEEMGDLDADLDGTPASEDELSLVNEQSEAASKGDTEAPSADEDEDRVFEEALSGLSTDEQSTETSESTADASADSEEDMDAELDFLADTDEAATKLDLARAYIDMGDADGARDILEEVRQEGNEQQQQEADELLGRIES